MIKPTTLNLLSYQGQMLDAILESSQRVHYIQSLGRGQGTTTALLMYAAVAAENTRVVFIPSDHKYIMSLAEQHFGDYVSFNFRDSRINLEQGTIQLSGVNMDIYSRTRGLGDTTVVVDIKDVLYRPDGLALLAEVLSVPNVSKIVVAV